MRRDDKTRIVNVITNKNARETEELEKGLSQKENGKAAREDKIMSEMLKESDMKTRYELAKLFNE